MVKHAADTLQALDPVCHKVARYPTQSRRWIIAGHGRVERTPSGVGRDLFSRRSGAGVPDLAVGVRSTKRPSSLATHRTDRQLLGAFARLGHLPGLRHEALLDAVKALLDQRHRASSAIEGFNAALRPFLYVHKGVTQGFLDLFRAYYNLRTRRWGRLKGTSAHQCLTGEAVGDWLTLLGFPPSGTLH